ncbi:MAG: hypothetical protein ABI867_13155, partial [Kofleriaceae bacterium]
MKRTRLVFALPLAIAPSLAIAQVPVFPNAPEAPVTLNPGQNGNQTPPAPPAPAPSKPAVVIVGPDGKVIGGDSAPAAPGGYYVGGGGEPGYSEPTVIHAGPTPELHVVRTGDTLWDICWYYF